MAGAGLIHVRVGSITEIKTNKERYPHGRPERQLRERMRQAEVLARTFLMRASEYLHQRMSPPFKEVVHLASGRNAGDQ